MKKLLVILIFISIFTGCSDAIVVPDKSELKQYPEFDPLLTGLTEFEGIKHNLEQGEYEFNFKTNQAPEIYLSELKGKALASGWLIEMESENSYSFSKENANPNLGYEVITIKRINGKFNFSLIRDYR